MKRLYFVLMSFLSVVLSSCNSESIKQLETGLSFAVVRENYNLDEFLQNGGAQNDKGVARFLLEGAGCSTIQLASSNGGFLFGRNFDWKRCNALILITQPDEGYSSISTVNTDFIKIAAGAMLLPEKVLLKAAVYAPLDGMNEKGLCVSVNMIQDADTINQDTGKAGLTTTTAIRVLLDKAANTDEAIALLSEYDFHASFNYMVHFAICDAKGKAVAVEYIDGKMSVIETPILTNFYLTQGKKYGIGTAQSHERFNVLEKSVGQISDKSGIAKILESVSKHNYNEFESTEWSVVFDQENLTATYYHREHYEKKWEYSLK